MLFDKVVSTLESVTPYIATVSSKNCNSMKNMVEESIYQLINAKTKVSLNTELHRKKFSGD